jgi:hypothetical protein
MRSNWTPFSARLRRPALRRRLALTLIEVVAGMTILGTVLASLIVARARYLEQWSRAERKQAAVEAADALLSSWCGGPAPSLRPATGELKETHLLWRTSFVRNCPELDARIMRLEIFDAEDPGRPLKPRPLAQVEVVVDAPPAPKENP